MLEPEFRCRETTDPPHGHRPAWPPPPPRAYNLPPGWWARLWRRLRGLLAPPAPVRHRNRRRGGRLAPLSVGAACQADVARIMAECADRDQGEEP